jgi:hypothetical protein
MSTEKELPRYDQTHVKPAIPVHIDGFVWTGSPLITLISTNGGWPVKLAALDRAAFFIGGMPFLGNIPVAGAMFRLSDIPDELIRVYIYGEENLAERLESEAGRKVYPNEMVSVVQFKMEEFSMRALKNHRDALRNEETRSQAEALKAEAKTKQQKVLIK